MNIAIITARGGSKRIPHKNIREFCGRPILEYSIDAALKSGIFDEVMVSTDSQEIADIACTAGAKVPFLRSNETSDDFATTADVLKEVLEKYQQKKITFDIACCIYPTAPFVTSEKLTNAVELLKKTQADTVLPVVAFSYPPQRGIVIRDHKVKWIDDRYISSRSQDLEPIYHDCGQFYCINVKSFLESGKLLGNVTLPLLMNEMEVQDIDNLTDWEIAEIKYHLMNRK